MSFNTQIHKRNRAKRKSWTKEEAEGFLHFYKARISEFNSARKKRKAYHNVLNDMKEAGITGPKTTVSHLEVKMTTLQRTYRSLATDPRNDNVPSPCMIQMYEIFGENRPIHDNSLNIGSSTAKTDADPDDYGDADSKFHENWDSFSADEHIKIEPDVVCPDTPSYHLSVKSEDNSEDTSATAVMEEVLPSPTAMDDHDLNPKSPALLLNTSLQNKKPRMNRARYLEEKLQLKIKSEKNKTERWEQFKAIEEKKIDLLRKLFQSIRK